MKTYFPNIQLRRPLDLYLLLCTTSWIFGFILLFTYSSQDLFASINGLHSDWGDVLMVWGTKLGEGPVIAFAAILLLISNKSMRNWPHILLIIAILTIPSLITSLLKSLANVPRPLTQFKDASWIHFLEEYKNNYHRSWPSGHTTGAFATSFLLTWSLSQRWVWLAVLFFFLAFFVGYTRIYLSQHFFEDVLAGSLVGTIVPYFLVWFFERKIEPKFVSHS